MPMNEISFFPSFLKLIFALAVVLGLMIAAVYLLKRFMNPSSVGHRDGSLIQVVSSRYIGPKSSILLLEVLGKGIVIGLSNGQMTLLAAIDDREALAEAQTLRQNAPSSPVLPDLLKRYTEKFNILPGAQKGGPRR
ncbi:MAG: flagellar biosynthetic protein FliO [Syntrophales bacterium]